MECDETLLLLMANVLMFGAHPFLRLSCSLLKLERVLRSKIWCAKLKTLKYIPYPMLNHSYHSVLARANKDILPPSAKGGLSTDVIHQSSGVPPPHTSGKLIYYHSIALLLFATPTSY